MKQYLLLRTNGHDIEILQTSRDQQTLQAAMKADYENMIPFDWANTAKELSTCDETHARLYIDDQTIWNWSIQETEISPLTDSRDVESAKQFIDACHFYVRYNIYRHLWKQHVIKDIESHMKNMGISLTEDEIDSAAHRHVYEGDYDCNLSYWDNIENNIQDVINQRIN